MNRNQTTFKELKKILLWLWRNTYSDFYRAKYIKEGVNPELINNINDFKKLPFLTKEELIKTPPFDRVFMPEEKIIGMQMTSGTTGTPLMIPVNRAFFIDRRGKVSIFNEVYKTMRKRGIKRMLTLRPSSNFNMFWAEWPADVFRVFADINNLSQAAKIAEIAKIDSIEASPSVLYFFTPYLYKLYDLKKIKLVRFAGEFCSELKLNILKEFYPNAFFITYYGATENHLRGYQCEYLAKKDPWTMHMAPGVYIESIDEETGRDSGFNKEGECIATSLIKRPFVTVRYKTGDQIMFLKGKCRCNDKGILFKTLGRIGVNSFPIQGTNLTESNIEKAISFVSKDIERDLRVHIYERREDKKIKYLLEFEIIPRNLKLINNERFKARVAKTISENFNISPTLTLEKLISMGVFLPLKIKLVKELPFENKRKIFVPHF